MYEDMKINFILFSLKYRAYVRMQITAISVLLLLSAVAYLYGRDSADWFIGNGWWICLVVALLEVGEAVVAITLAKKKYRKEAAQ
jgi:hypothetical protein